MGFPFTGSAIAQALGNVSQGAIVARDKKRKVETDGAQYRDKRAFEQSQLGRLLSRDAAQDSHWEAQDSLQSTIARAKAEKEAETFAAIDGALEAAGVADPATRKGIIAAGTQGSYLGKEKAILTPWAQAGFSSEAEWNASAGRHADATRAPVNPRDTSSNYTIPSGVTDPDGNPVLLETHTGARQSLPDLNQRAAGGMGAAGIRKSMAENTASLGVIDKAIAALDKHPQAFGLESLRGLPYIGSDLDQRADPGGNDARALVGNIGSILVHDRYGAAVSVREDKQASTFIPKMRDTPEKIRSNLLLLADYIRAKNMAMQSDDRPQGSPKPDGQKLNPYDKYVPPKKQDEEPNDSEPDADVDDVIAAATRSPKGRKGKRVKFEYSPDGQLTGFEFL